MNKTFSLPRTDRFSPWLAALLGIVAIKAVLSVSVKSVPFVFSYSGISYLLLLLLATIFSIRNGIHNTLRARPFWVLLAVGYGLWAFHQSLDLYYELRLQIDVPSDSIADEVLFLHLLPLMAAVATLPNLNILDGKQHRWILNTLLIIGFWVFLYGFMVAPFKYILFSPRNYDVRFDILYFVENLVLLLMLLVVTLRARPPWKMIYLHLLGASALYALSSTVANIAIDAGGYVNGKLYGLGLTASVCWFVWTPLSAGGVPKIETSTMRFVDRQDSQVSRWAMLSVAMISIPMVWELFHRDENANIRTLRLIVATAAIILLGGGAYLREYLDKRTLALEGKRAEVALRASEERLRLAAQAGRMYAEDWDVATDAFVRSGDLPNVLGLKDEDLGLTLKHYLTRVHPDDQALVAASLTERVPEHPFSHIRYRLVRPDGSIIWVERTDHAFFDSKREMVRMVGMVTNITEQKQSEDALRESEERFRSVFRDAGVGMVIISPEGRLLAANLTFCEDLGYTEEEILTKTVESITFHEDWPAFSLKLSEALHEGRGFRRQEKRCLHKSGRVIHTENSATLIRNSDGVPQFFVGEVLDVTARKESEEALASFNRRLIQAQEEERSRIAREIHDDYQQRLALISIDLENLDQDLTGDLASSRRLHELWNRVGELCSDLHFLSHNLHSSTLDNLGLVAALRSLCTEFEERHSIEVNFEEDNVPRNIPGEVALCLFRITQEALQNVKKHSCADSSEVRVEGQEQKIHLSVSDEGVGFDPGAVSRQDGIGIRSIEERVRLVGGQFTLSSQPMHGTKIDVWAPIRR
jgi:PAS domain S-box-containing protein